MYASRVHALQMCARHTRRIYTRDMLSAHTVLDDRFEFGSTAPRGGGLRHNLYERVSGGAPIDERSLTFMEHVGYGVSYYCIPPGTMKVDDATEMATRIAAVLPVSTSYDTVIAVMVRAPSNTGPTPPVRLSGACAPCAACAACASFAHGRPRLACPPWVTDRRQEELEYSLDVWGSGYNPQRVERLDELRRACEPRGPGQAARLRTLAHLEQCQSPLIEQSESYRSEVRTPVPRARALRRPSGGETRPCVAGDR